jgi:hypothetical protein
MSFGRCRTAYVSLFRRLRLQLRYARLVFPGEIQQAFFGKGVGLPGETPAAFGLLFQCG